MTVCTILKTSLYPVEMCVDFEPINSFWFQYLSKDAAYLHSSLWATQSYFDWLQGRPASSMAMIHQGKALGLLREKLNKSAPDGSDMTLAVVVTLVMMTGLVGDLAAAKTHMAGLHRMIMLRGGLCVLKENRQLQIKACRYENEIPTSRTFSF